MLKHVGHHRSTSSMTRASCSSLKVRGDPRPPKIIRTQDDSDLPYGTGLDQDDLYSSPESLRKNLSSPESCTSDLGSPEVIKRSCTKSGRSKSLQSSPVVRKKLLDVPEDFESAVVSYKQELLDVPDTFRNVSSGQESDGDPHSSPEISKKEISPRASTLPRRGAAQKALDILGLKGQPLRKSFRSADTCSIASTCSFTSLATGKLSSSTSSLADQTVTPVKVYLRFMRPDIEYKTLRLSTATTCRQLINLLLAKFRLRHRDPNLFFVRMEITVRSPGVGGAPTRRLLVLDDQARPAELQQCRPRGDARFSVGVRRGGLLRIHDSILMPGSQYKSLLVSYRTTAEELVQLLLNCYSSQESPRHYAVHEVNKCPYSDRPLRPDEYPLLVQSEWPRPARLNYAFVLRRNANYALSLKSRISWRRSLDQSSTDTESEHEDQLVMARKSRTPSLPVTRTPVKTIITCASRLSDTLTPSPLRTSIASTSSSLLVTSSSPSISRVSCDSGFSSPSSSSRSSTSSTGSPSPPPSPSPSVISSSKCETRFSKTSSPAVSSSASLLLKPSSSPSSSTSPTRVHLPVTVTVSHIAASSSSQPASSSAFSRTSTPVNATVVSTQEEEEPSQITKAAASSSSASILTIPVSPISTPSSPPSLTVLSSSVVVTSISPVASTPLAADSWTSAKRRYFPSSSCVSLYSNPLHTTFFSSSEPTSSIYVPLEGTIIPPSSAPTSPSSPTGSRRCVKPPSPSAPTSPSKGVAPLQSTIITIPTSGPSVVSSNTLASTSTSTGMKELTAALESLRTLTIRCPNYDSCFYI